MQKELEQGGLPWIDPQRWSAAVAVSTQPGSTTPMQRPACYCCCVLMACALGRRVLQARELSRNKAGGAAKEGGGCYICEALLRARQHHTRVGEAAALASYRGFVGWWWWGWGGGEGACARCDSRRCLSRPRIRKHTKRAAPIAPASASATALISPVALRCPSPARRCFPWGGRWWGGRWVCEATG